MQKPILLQLACFILLMTPRMTAQKVQISVSGTYGIIVTNYSEDFRTDEQFEAVGGGLGLELKFKKHFTGALDVDWQKLESELAVAQPYPTHPELPPVLYSFERQQFNIRPTVRYYFKEEAFRGFFVGVFGTYSYQTITTKDYPEQNYFGGPADPTDDFGLGGGLTYGYRLKLTSALRASAFGSHQLFWNDLPKARQQDHQFGLGLNWAF